MITHKLNISDTVTRKNCSKTVSEILNVIDVWSCVKCGLGPHFMVCILPVDSLQVCLLPMPQDHIMHKFLSVTTPESLVVWIKLCLSAIVFIYVLQNWQTPTGQNRKTRCPVVTIPATPTHSVLMIMKTRTRTRTRLLEVMNLIRFPFSIDHAVICPFVSVNATAYKW